MNEVLEAGRLHVAIIMDGNGRWATLRGLARTEGHRAGATRIRELAPAAPALGVETLTLYAFSANNWARPEREVRDLMEIFQKFFDSEASEWQRSGLRVSVIGRRDRLPGPLLEAIQSAEIATCGGTRLHLRLAIDYSGQEAIIEAARRLSSEQCPTREDFGRLMAIASHASPEDPPVDLLIRTGGEQRLSDFLLWELAYAELWFCGKLWPDFDARDLENAVRDFARRERRYGAILPAPLGKEARQNEASLV